MRAPRRRGNWDDAPAARWEDAFLAGNGRHGAMVHGDPADERIIVNHHLLVRPNGTEHLRAPGLAGQLDTLRADILAGRAAAAVDRTIPDGPLAWVRPFHPAFALRIRRRLAPRGPVTGYRREVDYRTGVVSTEWTEGEGTGTAGETGENEGHGGRWRAETFVSRTDDLIVHRLIAPPGTRFTADIGQETRLPGAPLSLHLAHRTTPSAPDAALLTTELRYREGEDPGFTGWTRLTVTGGRVAAPGDTPGGAAAPGRASGGAAAPAAVCEGTLRAEECTSLTLLTRVAPRPCPPALVAVPPAGTGYEELLARHLPAHRTPYDRVELDLHAPEEHRALPARALLAEPRRYRTALLERLFDAGRYHLLSASGLLPPRLTGLWTGEWDTAWSGALTCDANLNLQIASAAVAALPEVSLAHAAFIRRQLPDWRANAARLFGTRGIVAPAHTDGLTGHVCHYSAAYPLHLWTAGADWLLQPLLDHAQVTGDHAFRHTVLEPLLAEAADFWEDFLIPGPGQGADAGTGSSNGNGTGSGTGTGTGSGTGTGNSSDQQPDAARLLIVPSYSPENTPAGADSPVSVNAAMDIAAARHALTAAGRTPLAERLPHYHVNDDGALAEWSWPPAADRYDHRHLSHLYAVWPLDEINPRDTPALARAARRALQLRGTENDSAHGHLHAALIAARLGDAHRVEQALEAVLEGDFFHRSLMSAHYPGRSVYNADAAHALPAVLIEALLHSTAHGTHPLPAVPASLPAGTLRGIRTRHGTTVTDLTWHDGQVITLHEGATPCTEQPYTESFCCPS